MRQPHNLPSDPSLTIDWEHLHLISDNNLSFAFELLALLLADTQARVELLREAARQGNLADLHDGAHYIKGAAANIGVITIAAIAQKIETQDQCADLSTVDSLISNLEAALKALADWLEKQA